MKVSCQLNASAALPPVPTDRRLVVQGCIQKFPDWVDNEINNNKNKHSLWSNTKGYGGKTHYIDSQNSDTTAPIGRELYNLQFLLQAASPETFGYTLVHILQTVLWESARLM
jgi:hypothetical protein